MIDKIVENSLDIIKGISTHKINDLTPEELSQYALRLASNKIFLGLELTELDYQFNHLKMERKGIWADIFSEAKGTVKDRELEADKAVQLKVKEELEFDRKISILKNLRQDLGDCITTIQTRVSQLKQEWFERGLQEG